jgi:hypothetical protein
MTPERRAGMLFAANKGDFDAISESESSKCSKSSNSCVPEKPDYKTEISKIIEKCEQFKNAGSKVIKLLD